MAAPKVPRLPGRRPVVVLLCAAITGQALSQQDPSDTISRDVIAIDKWFSQLANRQKGISARPLRLQRFADPTYFVIEEFSWRPAAPDLNIQLVTVPSGFVTDLLSVPKVFWSILPPQELFSLAAVMHDYLYWSQTTTREVADQVFITALREADVSPVVINVFANALKFFGQTAWDAMTALKKQGEGRILKVFPSDPRTTTWQQFKTLPGVLAT